MQWRLRGILDETYRVIGDKGVPLTVSRSPKLEFPRVAPTNSPTAVVETITGGRISDIVPITIQPEATRPLPLVVDIVEEWGLQSFPASDPPANW
jgi:hypothetical protein